MSLSLVHLPPGVRLLTYRGGEKGDLQPGAPPPTFGRRPTLTSSCTAIAVAPIIMTVGTQLLLLSEHGHVIEVSWHMSTRLQALRDSHRTDTSQRVDSRSESQPHAVQSDALLPAGVAASNDGGDGTAGGPAHFIVLSNAGHEIQDTAAELRGLHPGAEMSGGGAQAVFLDVGAGTGPGPGREATVVIGFQCVSITSKDIYCTSLDTI